VVVGEALASLAAERSPSAACGALALLAAKRPLVRPANACSVQRFDGVRNGMMSENANRSHIVAHEKSR
jgi:hypothetical protein